MNKELKGLAIAASGTGLGGLRPEPASGLGHSAPIPIADRFYIDCEFDGHGGALLSMALVREDGRSLYLCIPDEPQALDPWVAANVWPLVHLRLPVGRTVVFINDWGAFIRSFIGRANNPTIIADSPVDIGRFCTVLSTGSDGGWASADYPLMTFEVHNVDCYPTSLPDAIQHNAWWDAMALRHKLLASRIEARSDETPQAVQPEGREPDPQGDAQP